MSKEINYYERRESARDSQEWEYWDTAVQREEELRDRTDHILYVRGEEQEPSTASYGDGSSEQARGNGDTVVSGEIYSSGGV